MWKNRTSSNYSKKSIIAYNMKHVISVEKNVSNKIFPIFKKIIDIEDYPNFIPYCSQVIYKKSDKLNNGEFTGTIHFKWKILHKSFTSHVACFFYTDTNICNIQLQEIARNLHKIKEMEDKYSEYLSFIEIKIQSNESIFHTMNGSWKLKRKDKNTTSVSFTMNVGLQNSLLNKILKLNIEAVCFRIYNAIVEQ
ncbi:SRPBCC family protein [Candidatus Fokinia crypta]|uniref:Polyketide cyclase/hydratase protein n=1 Tax=Candidatus Fokinia crypta TaxID=1920990 RepID=A0ABZ0UNV2_9RICK|nr:SRPBCC family protein [Candidatus Fokinia cryptica]WPX97808.1 Putative polyketide cyclase/hydratase protein [Candidatus Fokinia cryptica]